MFFFFFSLSYFGVLQTFFQVLKILELSQDLDFEIAIYICSLQ